MRQERRLTCEGCLPNSPVWTFTRIWYLQTLGTQSSLTGLSVVSIGHPGLSGFISLVQFSRSVVSDSLRPHEPQHTRPPCLSPTSGVYPNSCITVITPLYYCDTIPLLYADSNSIIYYSFFEWFVSHTLRKC